MNLYQLDTMTMQQCKLDSTDTEVRTEYAPMFLFSYNFAYERIMREKIKKLKTQAVTLDANKCFDITTDFASTVVNIEKISQYMDFSSDASYDSAPPFDFYDYDGAGKYIVPLATASTAMYIRYRYMPTRLAHRVLMYNVKAAATSKTIPVDEAITAADALLLIGKLISLYDTSLGTYQTLTIVSAASGVAGSATITVSETISGTLTADDIIYSSELTVPISTLDTNTPQFDEAFHDVLTYFAAQLYYEGKGINYIEKAARCEQQFNERFKMITGFKGIAEQMNYGYEQL